MENTSLFCSITLLILLLLISPSNANFYSLKANTSDILKSYPSTPLFYKGILQKLSSGYAAEVINTISPLVYFGEKINKTFNVTEKLLSVFNNNTDNQRKLNNSIDGCVILLLYPQDSSTITSLLLQITGIQRSFFQNLFTTPITTPTNIIPKICGIILNTPERKYDKSVKSDHPGWQERGSPDWNGLDTTILDYPINAVTQKIFDQLINLIENKISQVSNDKFLIDIDGHNPWRDAKLGGGMIFIQVVLSIWTTFNFATALYKAVIHIKTDNVNYIMVCFGFTMIASIIKFLYISIDPFATREIWKVSIPGTMPIMLAFTTTLYFPFTFGSVLLMTLYLNESLSRLDMNKFLTYLRKPFYVCMGILIILEVTICILRVVYPKLSLEAIAFVYLIITILLAGFYISTIARVLRVLRGARPRNGASATGKKINSKRILRIVYIMGVMIFGFAIILYAYILALIEGQSDSWTAVVFVSTIVIGTCLLETTQVISVNYPQNSVGTDRVSRFSYLFFYVIWGFTDSSSKGSSKSSNTSGKESQNSNGTKKDSASLTISSTQPDEQEKHDNSNDGNEDADNEKSDTEIGREDTSSSV